MDGGGSQADRVPANVLAELRRNYAWQVLTEGLRIVAHWEFIASALLWLVAVLGARSQVSSDDAWAVEGWLGIALAVVAVPTFFVAAPISLGRRRRDQLLALLDIPEITASLEPWLLVGAAPLIRVRIRNDSAGAHSFTAKIVGTSGIPPGPEPPWHVPWRHSRMRSHTLHPGDEEMLQVTWLDRAITFGGQTHPGGRFEISEYDQRLSKQHPWHCAPGGGPNPEGFVEVKVWHVATGRLVKHLLIALRPLAAPGQEASLYEHPLTGPPGELVEL